MFYRINNNTIKFYKVEIDKKIYKLREEIIKKYGCIEHRNIVSCDVINPIERNSKIINFKFKRKMFLFFEYDYDIVYYPEFVLLLDSLIESKNYNDIKKLNKYQAPLSVRKMEQSRTKNNILKRQYPYNSYIKDIKSCFKPVLIEEISYTNEIDMLNKLIEHNVENKKQLQKIVCVLKQQTIRYKNIIDDFSIVLEEV